VLLFFAALLRGRRVLGDPCRRTSLTTLDGPRAVRSGKALTELVTSMISGAEASASVAHRSVLGWSAGSSSHRDTSASTCSRTVR